MYLFALELHRQRYSSPFHWLQIIRKYKGNRRWIIRMSCKCNVHNQVFLLEQTLFYDDTLYAHLPPLTEHQPHQLWRLSVIWDNDFATFFGLLSSWNDGISGIWEIASNVNAMQFNKRLQIFSWSLSQWPSIHAFALMAIIYLCVHPPTHTLKLWEICIFKIRNWIDINNNHYSGLRSNGFLFDLWWLDDGNTELFHF